MENKGLVVSNSLEEIKYLSLNQVQ